MAIDLNAQWARDLADLRFVATPKRLRAILDGRPVLDTRDGMLVWEPRRVVPEYAVPVADLDLDLVEQDPAPLPDSLGSVLPPHHLDRHTVPGRSCTLPATGRSRSAQTTRRWAAA
jgi:hypothetical protein